MEFRCFNGRNNCDYCGSCHSEFKVRTSDEKRHIYNKALEYIFNLAKQNAYDDGVNYSIGLQKLDELIANISK